MDVATRHRIGARCDRAAGCACRRTDGQRSARLNGAWVLNRQQSSSVGSGDAAPEGGARHRGGFSGGIGGPGGMGRGTGGGAEDREAFERQRALMRELLEPLPRVTVTSERDGHIHGPGRAGAEVPPRWQEGKAPVRQRHR